MKEIAFISSHPNMETGSYRIWIHDLSFYLKKIGITTKINSEISKNTDVIILCKNDLDKVDRYKKAYPNIKLGIINPPHAKNNADFIIVGSIEEMASMSANEHVFLFPLIEKLYLDKKLKKHKKKDKLVIGFHGHFPHLAKFHPYLAPAIEDFSKEQDVELLVITTRQEISWPIGKPNIKNIKIIPWDINNAVENMYNCDIGVVPNVTNIRPKSKDIEVNIDKGLYKVDYMLRFKNKSNAGRLFVFMQLGIPVVADITPSNLHLLGNPKCGFAVFDKNGYLNAFRYLSSHKNRNEMAKSARKEFDRLYDPLVWAKDLCDKIDGIK